MLETGPMWIAGEKLNSSLSFKSAPVRELEVIGVIAKDFYCIDWEVHWGNPDSAPNRRVVRGSSGIAGVSRSLPTEHSLTWTDLTGSLNFFKFIQVHLFCFICALESEVAILCFTRPQRTQATFQACNRGVFVCVCVRVWWAHIKLVFYFWTILCLILCDSLKVHQ